MPEYFITTGLNTSTFDEIQWNCFASYLHLSNGIKLTSTFMVDSRHWNGRSWFQYLSSLKESKCFQFFAEIVMALNSILFYFFFFYKISQFLINVDTITAMRMCTEPNLLLEVWQTRTISCRLFFSSTCRRMSIRR